MRIAFTILLVVHGLIHLLGFLKGFDLAQVSQLRQPIGRVAGAFWLLSTLGFVLAAVILHLQPRLWWMIVLPVLVISQVLIIVSWSDAKFGTVANVIVLIPLLINFAEWLPSSFQSMYRLEVQRLAAGIPQSVDPVTDADLSPLPAVLQTYLRRVGVVGRPRARGFYARFSGRFRNGLNGPWMQFSSEQHNTIPTLERLFLMRAALFGAPMVAYHDFVGANAHFRVRALSIFEVVNGHGRVLNQSETVTIFNDICVLAPGALIDLPVRWRIIDANRVSGEFTRLEHTVTAELTFDAEGDLINFESRDRYFSEDGAQGRLLPWLTPLRGHRSYHGVRLPRRGDATWRTEHGDMVYGEFNLEEIQYFPAATAAPAI